MLVISVFFLSASCSQSASDGETAYIPAAENSTSGKITVSVDETYKPIIEAEVNAFHRFYPDAEVTINYKPEAECFEDLMTKQVSMIIAGRKLNEEELARFQKRTIVPKETKLATDAICILLNKENKDTLFEAADLRLIFKGRVTKWSKLFPYNEEKRSNDNITIVFDHPASSTMRYVKESIIPGAEMTKNVFAAGTNNAVIEYVAKNKNAIGIIGVNWLSDSDDIYVELALEDTKMAFIEMSGSDELQFVQPFQAFIGSGKYPLTREIYAISGEGFSGLGTGFVNFVAGPRGQRIILKSGLMPAIVPPRQVSLPPKVDGKSVEEQLRKDKEKLEEEIEFKYD